MLAFVEQVKCGSGNKPLNSVENCEIRRLARSKPSSTIGATIVYNTRALATLGNKPSGSSSIKISASNLGAKHMRLYICVQLINCIWSRHFFALLHGVVFTIDRYSYFARRLLFSEWDSEKSFYYIVLHSWAGHWIHSDSISRGIQWY